MIWIVENFSEGEDIFMLIQAVKDNGHKLIQIGRKDGFEYKQIDMDNECVVFYGSIQMSKLVSEHLLPRGNYPVVWDDFSSFECTKTWPAIREYLFNDNFEFYEFGKLPEKKWEIYEKFGRDAMIFIRPSCGEKTFAGTLVDLQDFDNFVEKGLQRNAKANDIVCISTPKNINGEWRYIVTNEGEIVAKSCYKYQNKITQIPSAPAKADEFVKKVLALQRHPARIYSLDVCQDTDGNFWLLEFNSFNSCGLYAMNKFAVVEAASKLAIKDYKTYKNEN